MLVLLGLNHTTAEISLRERLHFSKEVLPDSLRRLKSLPGVREAMILSTCNRVEVLADLENPEQDLVRLKSFLSDGKNLDAQALAQSFYVHTQDEAVHHLFRVTSSIDSMVVGEPQILGQVKEAFRVAMDAGTTGSVLNRCLHRAFYVAKRVRTETGIASHAVSMSSVAVELAEKIFENLATQVVLLVGAGEMMDETAARLVQKGVTEILVTNRTHERASELAERYQGTTFFFEKLASHLPRADIVIACTSSVDPLITVPVVQDAMKHRNRRAMYFIDLSVPRNVDEKVGEVENVYLYDVDDFSSIVDQNLKRRKKEMRLAEIIVESECKLFSERISDTGADPYIRQLSQKADDIAEQELQKTLKKTPGLTPQQEQAVRVMAASIAQKIIHDPIQEIKLAATGQVHDESVLHWIRRLFRL